MDIRVQSTAISDGGRGGGVDQAFTMVYELPQTTYPMTEAESDLDVGHQAHYSHSQDGFTPCVWSQEEKDSSQGKTRRLEHLAPLRSKKGFHIIHGSRKLL